MVRYLKRESPDIVQSFLFWSNIYGAFAAKIARVPIIITGRRSLTEQAYMKAHYRVLQNLVNRWTSAVMTNAHAIKNDCLRYEKNINASNIHVIYNGVDTSQYDESIPAIDLKGQFNIPDKASLIGIIGALSRYKAHDVFLKAAALILQRCPHAVFLVLGRDAGFLSILQTLTKELQIQDAVIFTGERSDVPGILATLDILVSSSWIEGLPNALLEGMAAAKAIVATRVGGTPELIQHERNGLLVPSQEPERMAEAIIRLIENPEIRRNFGLAARKKAVTIFSMPRMVKQTEQLYEKLMKKK